MMASKSATHRPQLDGTLLGHLAFNMACYCEGLARVAAFAQQQRASIHMPRIGAGLAGGDWDAISQIIEDELVAKSISVTVYDLPSA